MFRCKYFNISNFCTICRLRSSFRLPSRTACIPCPAPAASAAAGMAAAPERTPWTVAAAGTPAVTGFWWVGLTAEARPADSGALTPYTQRISGSTICCIPGHNSDTHYMLGKAFHSFIHRNYYVCLTIISYYKEGTGVWLDKSLKWCVRNEVSRRWSGSSHGAGRPQP